LLSRLYRNSRFAGAVLRRLEELSLRPAIVHANDHWEGILGFRLAEILGARSALFLRTSRITEREYFKYRCDRYELIASVGPALQARVQSWDKRNKIELIYDGIEPDEFLPPKQKPKTPPTRILAIGAERSSKGWADLIEALSILAQRGVPLPEQVDFTGELPPPRVNDLKLARVPSVRFRFLGRVEYFRDLVREYDLVVNPSRSDSFGMAAIETLGAGVPLLSSKTGVLAQVMRADHMLFPPNQPVALADALGRLMLEWGALEFGVADAQALIRQQFPIERTAAALDRLYRDLSRLPVAE
jgi:glycosyltransferase involved in cell wall biosynthesis